MHQLPIGGGGADPNAGMEEAQENVDANFEMADDYLGTGPSGDNTAANIIAQCGDDFTQFVVGDDGTLTQTQYDPNPTAGTFRGQSGAWFNSGGMIDDGWDGHYNASQDAFTGGELNTDVFKHSFVALPTLNSKWSTYNTPDWWDYTKVGLSMMAAGLEITASIASGGLLAPILGLDGATRIVNGVGRIYTLATEGKVKGESMPTNLLGDIGASIGGIGSNAQFYMQNTNDILTAAASGGIFGDIGELNAAINSHNTVQAVGSFVNMFDETNTLKDIYRQW